MTKFQKLAQIFKDIELLESYGDLKAADILHKQFIRLAQNEVIPASYTQDDRGQTYKKRFNQKLQAGLSAPDEKKENIINTIKADRFFFDEDKKQLESLIRGTSTPTSSASSTGNSTGTSTNQNFTELQTDLAKSYMAKLNAAKGEWDLDFIKMKYDREGLAPFEQKILDDRIENIKNTKHNNLMTGLRNSLDNISVPLDNSTIETTNESSIPNLQARIKHYQDKIKIYNSTFDQAKKNNMLKYLKKFIKENYDNQLLDSASYVMLMKQLGITIPT